MVGFGVEPQQKNSGVEAGRERPGKRAQAPDALAGWVGRDVKGCGTFGVLAREGVWL